MVLYWKPACSLSKVFLVFWSSYSMETRRKCIMMTCRKNFMSFSFSNVSGHWKKGIHLHYFVSTCIRALGLFLVSHFSTYLLYKHYIIMFKWSECPHCKDSDHTDTHMHYHVCVCVAPLLLWLKGFRLRKDSFLSHF